MEVFRCRFLCVAMECGGSFRAAGRPAAGPDHRTETGHAASRGIQFPVLVTALPLPAGNRRRSLYRRPEFDPPGPHRPGGKIETGAGCPGTLCQNRQPAGYPGLPGSSDRQSGSGALPTVALCVFKKDGRPVAFFAGNVKGHPRIIPADVFGFYRIRGRQAAGGFQKAIV